MLEWKKYGNSIIIQLHTDFFQYQQHFHLLIGLLTAYIPQFHTNPPSYCFKAIAVSEEVCEWSFILLACSRLNASCPQCHSHCWHINDTTKNAACCLGLGKRFGTVYRRIHWRREWQPHATRTCTPRVRVHVLVRYWWIATGDLVFVPSSAAKMLCTWVISWEGNVCRPTCLVTPNGPILSKSLLRAMYVATGAALYEKSAA